MQISSGNRGCFLVARNPERSLCLNYTFLNLQIVDVVYRFFLTNLTISAINLYSKSQKGLFSPTNGVYGSIVSALPWNTNFAT